MDERVAAIEAVHEVFMRTEAAITGPLAELGLTTATAQALWALSPDEEPPSMKTVAARLHCNAPNLSFVAGQLAARGLVDRVPDPRDGRSRALVLTEQGKQVRSQVLRITADSSPLAGLAPDDVTTLLSILERALSAGSP
ncbi:MarR family transcriptional regulator [Lentzea sp. NBRC 102530]|uniref:MarR family winged helix-turn-helix transcriptional regulator n=1 Tax=Lentzea sp. NBRC 102530 TaxID=3032201 RepID=UPI0024A47B56|nr:MarR family transcriptional regulator [Lentzea sp. NBRC 102530]GLY54481.1 DNA-binding protein [Lentzea sp. NBRC 102530]